jgi:uncharacterized tellurite resistance protein B-like protein
MTIPAENDNSLKNQIRSELEDLKKMGAAFGPAKLKDGTWFNEFVRAMLTTYAEKIIKAGGVEYFHQKYPGLTQDAIAEKLSTLAMRYAAIIGGVTGVTASSSVLGGLTIPLVLTAIGGEILYTTRLQVRLVYDLATIYGDPIDLNDPEQIYRAFMLAYGISVVSANAGGITTAVGAEVMRAQAYRFITGKTPIIQEAASQVLGPRIGALITRKAILKTIVPVAGVAIASGWNYVSTKGIAEIARQEFRLEALARQNALDLCGQAELKPDDLPLLVQAIQAVINIDGSLDPREVKVYQAIVAYFNVPREILQDIESRVDINSDEVETQLRAVKRVTLRRALAGFLKLAAAASGDINPKEAELLQRFLPALGETFDAKALEAQAMRYKRAEHKAFTQQVGALSKKIGGFFTKKPMLATTPAETNNVLPSPIAESELLERLKLLHAEGLLTNEELAAKQQELAVRAVASSPAIPAQVGNALVIVRLQVLANLMKADGTVDPTEDEFLQELIAGAELSDAHKADLQKHIAAKGLQSTDFAPLQNNPEEALSLMLDLVTMAQRDGRVHPGEKIYLKQVARQLGVPKEDVEELLAG